jgi:hypothetical protein
MVIRKLGVALGALCIISILASCTDGEALVVSASDTFKVDIALNSRSRSIEQSFAKTSIIRQGDEITPYLFNFNVDDPDVRGMTVFLKTAAGTILDGRAYYMLSESAIQRNQVDGELDQDEALPEIETNGNGADSNTQPQPETAPESTPQHAPIPVVEPWGGDRGVAEHRFTVERLDQDLPPFMLDSELAIGQYFLVFQVLGVRSVLYHQEQLFYFMGDAELTFNNIHRYLPGDTSVAQLAPPGSAIMFEAQLDFDERLDPYIIWYNNKKRIGEGRVADGLNRLIWTFPLQTTFQTIRAEVFPFKPMRKISGEIKELAQAISTKSENISYFAEKAEHFVCWYQFQNNLINTVQSKNARNYLVADGNASNLPRWLPVGNIYGLALGPRDRYILPLSLPLFTKEKEEQEKQGVGELLLHIKPPRDGTIIKAEFNTKPGSNSSKSDTVKLNCSFIAGKPVLLLGAEELTFESPPLAGDSSAYDMLTLAIKFSMSRNIFTASLYVKEFNQETEPMAIALSTDLDGKAAFKLGIENEKEDIDGAEAILDELAITFELKLSPPHIYIKELDNEGLIQQNRIRERKATLETTQIQQIFPNMFFELASISQP